MTWVMITYFQEVWRVLEKKDILICYSTSGKSKNIIKVLKKQKKWTFLV